EIDEIKEEIYEGRIPVMFRRKTGFKLIIEELDEAVYDNLANLARRLELPPGEILSFLMKEVVTNFDGNFPEFSGKTLEPLCKRKKLRISISSQEILTVTNQDLIEMNAKVTFHRIDHLQFVDVDIEAFKTYVDKIHHCGLIQVPASLSKLLVYAKCHHCDLIDFYEGSTPPDRPNRYYFRKSYSTRKNMELASEAKQMAREAKQMAREAKQMERDAAMARRRIELPKGQYHREMRGAGETIEESQMHPGRRLTKKYMQNDYSNFQSDMALFELYSSLGHSKQAYDQAYMSEMASYLRAVQDFIRRAPH
ncbi:MAG: hypothetical protein ACFFB3_22970, partial [Candidatus Hodarchaeota archaeon]